MSETLTLLAAFLLGTVAVARAVRLITADAFPPAAWLRHTLINWGAHRSTLSLRWAEGISCPFCVAPYAAAANLTWALTAGIEWDGWWSQAWWVVNLWVAGSYLASMLVVRDEPPEEG